MTRPKNKSKLNLKDIRGRSPNEVRQLMGLPESGAVEQDYTPEQIIASIAGIGGIGLNTIRNLVNFSKKIKNEKFQVPDVYPRMSKEAEQEYINSTLTRLGQKKNVFNGSLDTRDFYQTLNELDKTRFVDRLNWSNNVIERKLPNVLNKTWDKPYELNIQEISPYKCGGKIKKPKMSQGGMTTQEYDLMRQIDANALGSAIGSTARGLSNIIPGTSLVNALSGVARAGLDMIDPDAKDEYGVYKDNFRAGVDAALDPIGSTWNLFGKGLEGDSTALGEAAINLFVPGLGGSMENKRNKAREEQLKGIQDKKKKTASALEQYGQSIVEPMKCGGKVKRYEIGGDLPFLKTAPDAPIMNFNKDWVEVIPGIKYIDPSNSNNYYVREPKRGDPGYLEYLQDPKLRNRQLTSDELKYIWKQTGARVPKGNKMSVGSVAGGGLSTTGAGHALKCSGVGGGSFDSNCATISKYNGGLIGYANGGYVDPNAYVNDDEIIISNSRPKVAKGGYFEEQLPGMYEVNAYENGVDTVLADIEPGSKVINDKLAEPLKKLTSQYKYQQNKLRNASTSLQKNTIQRNMNAIEQQMQMLIAMQPDNPNPKMKGYRNGGYVPALEGGFGYNMYDIAQSYINRDNDFNPFYKDMMSSKNDPYNPLTDPKYGYRFQPEISSLDSPTYSQPVQNNVLDKFAPINTKGLKSDVKSGDNLGSNIRDYMRYDDTSFATMAQLGTGLGTLAGSLATKVSRLPDYQQRRMVVPDALNPISTQSDWYMRNLPSYGQFAAMGVSPNAYLGARANAMEAYSQAKRSEDIQNKEIEKYNQQMAYNTMLQNTGIDQWNQDYRVKQKMYYDQGKANKTMGIAQGAGDIIASLAKILPSVI